MNMDQNSTFCIRLTFSYPYKQGKWGKTDDLILPRTITGKSPTNLGFAGTCEKYSTIDHEINRQAPCLTNWNVVRIGKSSPVCRMSSCQSTVNPLDLTLPRTIWALWSPGKKRWHSFLAFRVIFPRGFSLRELTAVGMCWQCTIGC